jgi:hypothetical protein
MPPGVVTIEPGSHDPRRSHHRTRQPSPQTESQSNATVSWLRVNPFSLTRSRKSYPGASNVTCGDLRETVVISSRSRDATKSDRPGRYQQPPIGQIIPSPRRSNMQSHEHEPPCDHPSCSRTGKQRIGEFVDRAYRPRRKNAREPPISSRTSLGN